MSEGKSLKHRLEGLNDSTDSIIVLKESVLSVQSKENHDTDKIKKHGLDRLKDSTDKKSVSSVQSNKSVLQTEEIRPGYQLTKVGLIPEDWDYPTLSKLTKITSGATPNRKEPKYWNGDIPWVTTSLIKFNRISKAEEFITENGLKNTAVKLFPKGTVLIALYGLGVTRGKCAILEVEATTNQACAALLPSNGINSEFLFYALNNNYFRIRNLSNIGGQDNLSGALLRSFHIPLPELPEQKAIAQILSTWDKAIDNLDQLITEKQQKKKALMQQLLTGKKRFLGFVKNDGFKESKIGLVPQDWDVCKAKDLFNSVSIKNNGDEELLAVTQDRSAIPRSMLEGRVMSPDGSTSGYKLVVPGNFIISLRSFQGGLEYSEYRGLVSPAYTILEEKVELDKSYFKYFFKSSEFISRLAVAVIGIRDGKQIAFGDFGFMDFRFPPFEEQQKIAEVLNTASKEIELLNKKLDAIKDQKKGLMQQLLTGKKRLRI